MSAKQTDRKLSIIVPFLDEEGALPELYNQLQEVLKDYAGSSEIIFVDDGSQDSGAQLVKGWTGSDPRVKLISFKKNYRQTAAMAAGIRYSTGELIAFLDADLQNDPHDLPKLIAKLDEGYDVVSGWRAKRKDSLWWRKVPSWLANRLISAITGVHLHDFGCSLKVYRGSVLRGVRLYGEMHRFLPAYCAWEGAKIVEVPVTHHARTHGRSKYGLGRTFKVLLDLVTVTFLGGFSTKPIYFFGGLGGASFLCGILAFSIVAYRVLILQNKEATPMVFLMVIFILGGIQFVMMGLLAEIAVRTYHESRDRQTYRIREMLNLASSAETENERAAG